MTYLDSIFKSRDITLPTKVHPVKAMVFPVVMYGCESWTVKKAERRRSDAFELWYWRRLLSPLNCKEIQPVHSEDQPWDFLGKNTRVNCHSLLQVAFLTQGLNPHLLCLLHWQAGSYTVLDLYLKYPQVNFWMKVLCRGFFPFLKVIVKIESSITSSSRS